MHITPVRKAVFLFCLIFTLTVFLGGSKTAFASVVFDQPPTDETYNGKILVDSNFVSFGCTLALNCGVSGQTIYNVGVWMKKVGNPDDISLRIVDSWNNVAASSSPSSNSVSASTISDSTYNLVWFYFPAGVVVSYQNNYDQFFQFQFTHANGTYSPTDYYKVLQHPQNDYSGFQQWCAVSVGCASSPLYFKLDNSPTDLSAPTSTCSVDCFSNVLFIPGFEASRLYKPFSGGETQLWEPGGNGDAGQLILNPDGTSANPNIYSKDVISETNRPVPLVGALGQNIYKSFSSMLDGLVSDNKITAWQSYAYDWRMSVQDIVDNGTMRSNGKYTLADALTALASASKSGKVTIIAHSNGGLITKTLLKKLEDDKSAGRNTLIDKIDTVILVASPQWGTPSTIPAILHGYDQGIALNLLLNPATARAMARNMPGAYGLLPSAEYYNHVSNPVITFVPNQFDPYMSKDLAKYGQSISTYTAVKDFMLGGDGRGNQLLSDTIKPIIANSLLLTQAENLHSSIDTMTVPASIRIVQIAGWGLETIAGFQYNASSTCSSVIDDGCTGNYILDEKPIFTSDGDHVVVTPSALAMSGEKYWLNLPIANQGIFTSDRKHSDILEVTPLLDFLSSKLQNVTPVDSVYLSTTLPVDVKNRLRLSVHSPVTIDAYDANGNHTGKICPPTTDLCYTEENIPNSLYMEFGEGKYLNLPQDALQKVVLQGTDVGTFTFDSQVVTPSGQTTTSSFIDIPVTTQTQAEVTLNTTGTPQLKLDVTGDGVTDFTLAPSSTFDPITYLQIMKSTVDSLDLTPAKIKAFDTRIDNIIKSIQKGKIDKAKLKADKFKTVLEKRLAKPDQKKPKPKKLSKTDAQLLLDMLNQLLDNIG